jgi:hypothetical protein
MLMVTDMITKKGDRIGDRKIKALTPVSADKIYGRGVTKNWRTKAIKPAVICFEWLQRPENVLAGFIRWTDYRGREAPTAIRITHHKTGAVVLHPLEDTI